MSDTKNFESLSNIKDFYRKYPSQYKYYLFGKNRKTAHQLWDWYAGFDDLDKAMIFVNQNIMGQTTILKDYYYRCALVNLEEDITHWSWEDRTYICSGCLLCW